MLEYLILGFLMSGDMSGYDLKQNMLKYTSNFINASFGSIYPALKRIETKGFVHSYEKVEGRIYKKLYSISAQGKEELISWLEQPLMMSKTRPDHMIQIFFYEYLEKDKAIKNIKAFIAEVEKILKNVEKHEEKAIELTNTSSLVYRASVLLFGINYYRFEIDWCKNLLKKIEGELK